MTDTLPNLCYVGPPLAASVGGSALLYKLLHNYPADRLAAIELPVAEGRNIVRLGGVRPVVLPSPPSWTGPRGRTLYDLSFLFGRSAWGLWLSQKISSFHPDMVVCVVHGWICEAALETSRQLGIPFHAVLHDHANTTLSMPRFLHQYRMARWAQLCRRARSRLCVSPFMAEEVQGLTGRSCDILYPGLAPDTNLSSWAPPVKNGVEHILTFSFVGTVHSSGYRNLVLKLAQLLGAGKHQLFVHSPHATGLVQDSRGKSLVDGGLIPTNAVVSTLSKEADVAFLPMSFQPADAANMRVGFPSKLVEYCGAGRPVLIWGPPYCSAVRWAKEHPGFAEIVETESEEDVYAAICRLTNPVRREKMGKHALQLARDCFSHEKTFGRLIEVLTREQ